MSKKDFSIFYTMSTRVLQEILYQDSILPEGEGFDQDAVLYVMQVLAQREEGRPPAEEAWRRFNEHYRHKDLTVPANTTGYLVLPVHNDSVFARCCPYTDCDSLQSSPKPLARPADNMQEEQSRQHTGSCS